MEDEDRKMILRIVTIVCVTLGSMIFFMASCAVLTHK